MRTGTYLQALAFHPVENPNEEVLHLQPTLAGQEVSWGSRGSPERPRTLSCGSRGGGDFRTAGPWPGRMQLHPWSRVERGEHQHFRVIFWGNHVRVVLISAGRDPAEGCGMGEELIISPR